MLDNVGVMTFTVKDEDPVVWVYDRIRTSCGEYVSAFENDTLAVTRLVDLSDVSEIVRLTIKDRATNSDVTDTDVMVVSRGRVDCEADLCTYTFEGYQVYVGTDICYVIETDEDRVLDRTNEFLEETKEWVN